MCGKWRNVLALTLLFLLLVGCVEKKTAAVIPSVPDKTSAPSKIHPKISEFLKGLANAGKPISSNFIRTNAAGKIQVYIYVSAINQENRQALERCSVDIELQNETLLLMQAWVPSDQFESVAKLSFVIKITPPSYGHI